MKNIFALIAAVLAAAFQASSAPQGIDEAISRGTAFLLAAQAEDGHWSDPHMPALSALPVWALLKSNGPFPTNAVEKGVAFVLSTQRDDGGFYVPKPGRGGSGLGNYNTSVCLSALYESGRAPVSAMLKAREYIASTQLTGDDTMAGGFGYDKASRRRYADLSNTSYALDAMHRTASLEEMRPGGRRVDVDWDKAMTFVEGLLSQEGGDKGGAAYNGRTPQGGVETNASGRVHLRAYGSMTYAAVLSMCHANLERSDPRVKEALEYMKRNWTVDENPSMGQQGLYYYYDIMSRALKAAAVDSVAGHDWRAELSGKLMSLQSADGSWANSNNRFWEADKVLCTSFAILALDACRKDETR